MDNISRGATQAQHGGSNCDIMTSTTAELSEAALTTKVRWNYYDKVTCIFSTMD